MAKRGSIYRSIQPKAVQAVSRLTLLFSLRKPGTIQLCLWNLAASICPRMSNTGINNSIAARDCEQLQLLPHNTSVGKEPVNNSCKKYRNLIPAVGTDSLHRDLSCETPDDILPKRRPGKLSYKLMLYRSVTGCLLHFHRAQLYMSLFAILCITILLASCSATKRIPGNDALYTGAAINLEEPGDSSKINTRSLKAELNGLLRPEPNDYLLGMPVEVMMYNFFYTEKKKGLTAWLQRKLGDPPVLASAVKLEKNRQIMENRLLNKGFFSAEVKVDTTVSKKKMHATYTALLRPQYRIRSVHFPEGTDSFSVTMRSLASESLLKVNDPYDLETIKSERQRIDKKLKELGYYYFSPDCLIADVDSTAGNHMVDMYLRLKKDIPENALHVYRINDVIVYAEYNAGDSIQDVTNIDTVNGYRIVDPAHTIQPDIFPAVLTFNKGDLYNRTDHNYSLNRLVSLGVYKFVKARFQETDTTAVPALNTFYYLTPAQKKSFYFEVSALTKSNNSNGGEFKWSWRNRNIFRRAEMFDISVFAGFERQVYSQQPTVNTDRYGGDMTLILPRIIPRMPIKATANYLPKTSISAGYELFKRTTQYTLSSAHGSYGYIWKENVKKMHQLSIASINFVKPLEITPEYQAEIDTNITLARAIEQQFIIGAIYNYNYNSRLQANSRKHNYYFNGNIDISGNLIGLITGANANEGKQVNIFGTPFSQFIRLDAEFRHYMRVGANNMLVSRFNAGMGYAYGNSFTMPFIKQFFSGGASSIRAFRARSLGPGTYYGGNPQEEGFLPDQPGDIKLEVNSELRAKLFSFLYGAVFVDAGNIWLFKEDSARPGGKISSAFLQQFAVGTGLGLRVDVSFFVLRLDVSFPIRKPFAEGGPKWVFDEIDLGSSSWRKANVVYNIAVGYPF